MASADPRELDVDAEVRRQEDRAVEPEAAEQERHDERLGEGEAPGDEPAEERAEAAPDVGVHPAGRRQVAGQLGHREGREQDRDHREQDGERRDAAGERCRGADRQGGRNRRRHVGDRLEQHLGESDGVRAPAMGFPLRLPRLRSRECPPPMPPLVTTRRALASRHAEHTRAFSRRIGSGAGLERRFRRRYPRDHGTGTSLPLPIRFGPSLHGRSARTWTRSWSSCGACHCSPAWSRTSSRRSVGSPRRWTPRLAKS